MLAFLALLGRLGIVRQVSIEAPRNVLNKDVLCENQNLSINSNELGYQASRRVANSATAAGASTGENNILRELNILSIRQKAEKQGNLREGFIHLRAGELVELEVVIDDTSK